MPEALPRSLVEKSSQDFRRLRIEEGSGRTVLQSGDPETSLLSEMKTAGSDIFAYHAAGIEHQFHCGLAALRGVRRLSRIRARYRVSRA